MARLLALGDIHLGRLPSLPGVEARDELLPLSPRWALARALQAAREEGLDAVLLAGDVVDDEHDRFEARTALEEALAPLGEAGIPVVAVAGNHDARVLPPLADRLPGLHLLGAGGRWEIHALPCGVEVLGWSFPDVHHGRDPTTAPGLREALEGHTPGRPLLGLLHADLDARVSPYAPVPRTALEALGADAWLLGHVHRPAFSDAAPLGYLGCLVGMDRSEMGPRGPWEITVGEDGRLQARHRVDLCPLRYAEVTVEPRPTADALLDAAQEAARGLLAREPVLAGYGAVALQVRVEGAGRLPAGVEALLGTAFREGGTRFHLGWVVDATRPVRDLDALAGIRGPLGLLARLLAGKADPDQRREALEVVAALPRPPHLRGLEDACPPPDPERLLDRAAARLLDRLLAEAGDA